MKNLLILGLMSLSGMSQTRILKSYLNKGCFGRFLNGEDGIMTGEDAIKGELKFHEKVFYGKKGREKTYAVLVASHLIVIGEELELPKAFVDTLEKLNKVIRRQKGKAYELNSYQLATIVLIEQSRSSRNLFCSPGKLSDTKIYDKQKGLKKLGALMNELEDRVFVHTDYVKVLTRR